jgi:hypothetical protein
MDSLNPQVWARINQVAGWLSPEAADFTYRLMQTDAFRTTKGALVEIGVFKGKYLALLAHAAQGQDRRMIGIDGFFAGYQKPLEQQWIEKAREEMIGNIKATCDSQAVELVQANSTDLSPKAFESLVRDRCAFLSIDAGHDAHEVYNDFRISCGLLSEGSILAADDVFNPKVPGVAEGVFRFLCSSEGRLLAPFATCGNKLFLCARKSHSHYVMISHEFQRTATSGYLLNSKVHNDRNAQIGFVPRMFGSEVVPFF